VSTAGLGPARADDVAPLVRERVAPAAMTAQRRLFDEEDVQRRRFVGEIAQLPRPWMGSGTFEQIDQRNRGEDTRPALGTRGHGCRIEIAQQREQRASLDCVERDFDAVVVHEAQPG
jgi:hypothetical protein